MRPHTTTTTTTGSTKYLSTEQQEKIVNQRQKQNRIQRLKQSRYQGSQLEKTHAKALQSEKNEKMKTILIKQKQLQYQQKMQEIQELKRLKEIEKQKIGEERDQQEKQQKIQSFKSKCGTRAKKANDFFQIERIEQTREENDLKKRREQVLRFQSKYSHQNAEAYRRTQALIEANKPKINYQKQIHTFSNKRDCQTLKLQEYKNTTFHNTHIVKHDPSQFMQNASEKAIEEEQKARLRLIQKENKLAQQRANAANHGSKAMSKEIAIQEEESIIKELEKLQKADGQLKVKQKVKSRTQLEREKAKQEQKNVKMFDQEFDLAALVAPKPEKAPKPTLAFKKKPNRIPSHRVTSPPKDKKRQVKMTITQTEDDKQSQSMQSSQTQMSVSIKVPSVSGVATNGTPYQQQKNNNFDSQVYSSQPKSNVDRSQHKQPNHVRFEESKQINSYNMEQQQDDDDDDDEYIDEQLNTISNTLKQHKYIPQTQLNPITHKQQPPMWNGYQQQQPSITAQTPVFQQELQPNNRFQQHDIPTTEVKGSYSPLRNLNEKKEISITRQQAISTPVQRNQPEEDKKQLTHSQKIKKFINQNRQYLPQKITHQLSPSVGDDLSSDLASSLPYSSSYNTNNNNFYNSLNQPKKDNETSPHREIQKTLSPSIQNNNITRQSPIQSPGDFSSHRDGGGVRSSSSVATSQLLEQMSMGDKLQTTIKSSKDTGRHIDPRQSTIKSNKSKKTSQLATSLASIEQTSRSNYSVGDNRNMFHGNNRDYSSRENMVDEFFDNHNNNNNNNNVQEEQKRHAGFQQQSQYNSLKFDTFNPVKNINPNQQHPTYDKDENNFQKQVKFNVPLPLRKQDVQKYVYAQQDPHQLSTPGRITNPDNASQSEVTIEESPLPNFAAQEEEQSKFKNQGAGKSAAKEVDGSDVDFNYSFSEIGGGGGGGGRSTLKKSQTIPKDEGKIAQDVLQFQKMVTEEYKKKYEESDKQHRDALGLSQQQQEMLMQQEKKEQRQIGDNFPGQQKGSLADVFRARKFQMLSKFQNRKVLKDAEFEKKRSSASSTVSGRSKEEILKLRKEMMKPKNKPASEGDSPVQQQSQGSELMRRLAHGEKVKLSKKEMHDLSSKNYEKLPQIQKQKADQQKKEMLKLKQEKMKQFDQQRKIDMMNKKKK